MLVYIIINEVSLQAAFVYARTGGTRLFVNIIINEVVMESEYAEAPMTERQLYEDLSSLILSFKKLSALA